MGQCALPGLRGGELPSEAANQSAFYLGGKTISSAVAALERRWLLQQNASCALDVDGPYYLQDHMQGWILKCLSANARKVKKRN